ncbi:hypothetical protein QQP08_014366 [Theobroma cacao]|nr:hypothetical protein QQP08_014366 [Theobroma cacao]
MRVERDPTRVGRRRSWSESDSGERQWSAVAVEEPPPQWLPSKKYSENQQKQQLQINDHASLSTKQRSHSPNSLLSFQFHHKVWQATVSLRLLEKS